MEVRVDGSAHVLDRIPPRADHRVHYGILELQFGDLWLPAGRSPRNGWPLVVFLHGGWWRSAYDLSYAGHLCAALKEEGIAVWSIEYRRVGSSGGGWPTTFRDVARGFDYVAMLGLAWPVDLSRVVAAGHSAGAHLAFWLAGRHHVPHESAIFGEPKMPIRGLIGLAGVVDLRLTVDLAGYFTFAHDKGEVYSLMGGSPKDFPERYRAGSPGDLLPFGVPQTLIQGTEDSQIPPELPGRWAERARRQGDVVTVRMIRGADHFDVMDPLSAAWPVVRDAMRAAAFG